jgi:hypothetical protein
MRLAFNTARHSPPYAEVCLSGIPTTTAAGHHLVRSKQPAQAPLGRHHLLSALQQLAQQRVQFQPRQIRKRQIGRVGVLRSAEVGPCSDDPLHNQEKQRTLSSGGCRNTVGCR